MTNSPLFSRQGDTIFPTGRFPSKTISMFGGIERGLLSADETQKALEESQSELSRLNGENSLLRKENQLLRNAFEFGKVLTNITVKDLAIHQTIQTLHFTLQCSLIAFFSHDSAAKRLDLFYPIGPEATLLKDKLGERWERYHHSLNSGLLGRAIRAGKIQINNEPDETLELLHVSGEPFHSLLAAPVYSRGYLEGVILLADHRENLFDGLDIHFTADIAGHLSSALERISYAEHERDIIHSTAHLVEIRDLREVLHSLAQITCNTTGARMAIAAIYEEPEWTIALAGQIDNRLAKDYNGLSAFLRFAANQNGPFPLQDLRTNDLALALDIEDPTLRSLLACPFNLSDFVNAQQGVLIALGKQSTRFFNIADEEMIQLLATTSAFAINYSLTKSDLSANLDSIQLAHNLSLDIARSSKLSMAARAILVGAKHLAGAETAGLVLVDEDDKTIVQIGLPDDLPVEAGGDSLGLTLVHPMEKIHETIHTGEQSLLPSGDMIKKVYPIQTQERCYGALWLEMTIHGSRKSNRDVDIRSLINQTSVALESCIRNSKVQVAYSNLEKSHNDLKISFNQAIVSLTTALDKREHETKEHSRRLETLALRMGQELGLSPAELNDLRYGALLHDIGKIVLKDTIFDKGGSLTEDERRDMEKHALNGAEIVSNFPGLEGAAQVIHSHHELWNGSGYPRKLAGDMIPMLARIVTVADVFDALTNVRIYREKVYSHAEALEYLQSQAGVLYDPNIVAILTRILPELSLNPEMAENI